MKLGNKYCKCKKPCVVQFTTYCTNCGKTVKSEIKKPFKL